MLGEREEFYVGMLGDRRITVVQEAVICVAKSMPTFEYKEAGSFKSWLLNLTRWRIADQFRLRAPAGAMAPSDGTGTGTPAVERVAGADNLDAEWEVEWQRNIVEAALARVGRKVNPKHLQIFDLYALRHWPAGKVARELGVTRIQVYLVYHRLTKLIKCEVEFLGRKLE